MHAFYDNITDRARKALEYGNAYAKAQKHPLMTRLHVLYGILAEEKNVAVSVLKRLGVDTKKLKEDVVASLGEGKYKSHEAAVPYSKDVCKLICIAIDFGLEVKHIACQHLLKALLTDLSDPAGLLLHKANVTMELLDAQIKASVKPVVSKPKAEKVATSGGYPETHNYGGPWP